MKQVEAYKAGDLEKALQDAFLGFDATLLSEDVIEELKQLAKKNPDAETAESDVEDEENLADLCQEAHMPLKDVLERYKGGNPTNPDMARLQASAAATNKPISPYLRGRRDPMAGGSSSNSGSGSSAAAGGSSSNTNGGGAGCSSSSSSAEPKKRNVDVEDATVSSSSSSRDIETCVGNKKMSEAESSDWVASNGKNDIPDSSSTKAEELKATCNSDSSEVTQSIDPSPKQVEVPTNGEISGSDAVDDASSEPNNDEAKIESSTTTTTTTTPASSKAEGVSSSSSNAISSVAYENGEVSSNTNNGENGAANAAGSNANAASGSSTTAAASASAGSSSNNISSTEKNIDSSTDESDEEATYEGNTKFSLICYSFWVFFFVYLQTENSDTEDGDEDPDLEEIDSEEEDVRKFKLLNALNYL